MSGICKPIVTESRFVIDTNLGGRGNEEQLPKEFLFQVIKMFWN